MFSPHSLYLLKHIFAFYQKNTLHKMNYNFVKDKNLVIMDPFLNLKYKIVELLTIETSSQLLCYKNKAWITFYTYYKVVFRIKITTIAPIFLSNIKEDNEVKRYFYISTELIELHFYDTKKHIKGCSTSVGERSCLYRAPSSSESNQT